MRLGFACSWRRPAPPTWSFTPWHLRQALAKCTEVVDLPAQSPVPVQAVLRAVYPRLNRRAARSAWRVSAWTDRPEELRVRVATRLKQPDAVLQIQNLATVAVPHYFYMDLTAGLMARLADSPVRPFLGLAASSDGILRRRHARQQDQLLGCDGLFTMSQWLADNVVSMGEIPAEKVHVVHAGRNAPISERSGPEPSEVRKRLLFVGKDFIRKGGEATVSAVQRVRETHPDIVLTIVGPPSWPLPGPIPPWVRFLGNQSPSSVARLMASHDVFVMPSQFEAYGIVFAEALAHGLPCVGRDAFAMPELISDQVNGALAQTGDPDSVSTAIIRVLESDEIFAAAWRTRHSVADRFSWNRVAAQMVSVMEPSVRPW